jgi:hypothetical protein
LIAINWGEGRAEFYGWFGSLAEDNSLVHAPYNFLVIALIPLAFDNNGDILMNMLP